MHKFSQNFNTRKLAETSVFLDSVWNRCDSHEEAFMIFAESFQNGLKPSCFSYYRKYFVRPWEQNAKYVSTASLKDCNSFFDIVSAFAMMGIILT